MNARIGKPIGYTLLELIITLAIISVLASVAIPKFANTLLKSQQAAAKGNMGTLRTAISVYYADNLGTNPFCVAGAGSTILQTTLVPNYIGAIPRLNNGLHPPTNSVYCDVQIAPGNVHDGQGWYYDGVAPQDSQNGGLWVACGHTDTKGTTWSNY